MFCKNRYLLLKLYYFNGYKVGCLQVDLISRAIYGVGLQPIACWDYAFESRRRQEIRLL